MLVIKIDRLNEEGSKTSIDLHCHGIDFTSHHAKKEYANTTIAVMRSGVVLWLDIDRDKLYQIMVNYKEGL